MQLPLVFGTAGHVDHGKTTLVKALTGIDLDTLPEEKERGITIALGFVPLKLPSGRLAGLVDVPGHERLIRTMIAGASGMDAVLLCVSAAEGVMPQTREHLHILGLLGVKTGILVLTKVDLVDSDLMELAEAEILEQVQGTFLENAPVIRTSATQNTGIPELLDALDRLPSPPRDPNQTFRMPIDRSFARKGFGTVVTGTTWSGTLADGSEIAIYPGGKTARVRGIQIHKTSTPTAPAGSRVALNLAGIDASDAPKGAWIATPHSLHDSHILDARYTQLPDAPALTNDTHAIILLGTREVSTRVVIIHPDTQLGDPVSIAPGEQGFIQLRTAEPLPCRMGDRFILRRESPATTLGGGSILDPNAPKVRKAQLNLAESQLTRLENQDPEAWLERAGNSGRSVLEVESWPQNKDIKDNNRLGERYFSQAILSGHRTALLDRLRELHREQPLSPGHSRKALKTGRLLALGEREFQALVEEHVKSGEILQEGPRLWRKGFVPVLTVEQERWWQAASRLIEKSGVEGIEKLRETLPSPDFDGLLFLMKDRQLAVAIGERVYGMAGLNQIKAKVKEHFTNHPSLDPASFKDFFGLTRKTAIPLLEWLDGEGWTRRTGDLRIAGARLGEMGM